MWFFRTQSRKKAYDEAWQSMTLVIDDSLLTAEYGSAFHTEELVKEHGGYTMTVEGTVNTWQTGEQTVTVHLEGKDAYGTAVERSYPLTVTVQDTHAPEIFLNEESVTVLKGADFDPTENILSVSDPADGELICSDTASSGTYTVTSDTDTNTPGVYTVTVNAEDANGLQSSDSYKVTVYDPLDSAYPYYIRINRALNTVTVYMLDADGKYTVPLKAMVCSTGTATPLGTYHTTVKYRWRALYGGVYGQYATRIVGSILFHSVPYYTQNPGNLEYLEYNKLGTAASMGCIRLCVRDVKWIYDNCPIGTAVEIYDDAQNPGPLGKPVPLTIDTNSKNRGWDPTDPNPDNPWRS